MFILYGLLFFLCALIALVAAGYALEEARYGVLAEGGKVLKGVAIFLISGCCSIVFLLLSIKDLIH